MIQRWTYFFSTASLQPVQIYMDSPLHPFFYMFVLLLFSTESVLHQKHHLHYHGLLVYDVHKNSSCSWCKDEHTFFLHHCSQYRYTWIHTCILSFHMFVLFPFSMASVLHQKRLHYHWTAIELQPCFWWLKIKLKLSMFVFQKLSLTTLSYFCIY